MLELENNDTYSCVAGENVRATDTRVSLVRPVLSCAHHFQAPATQAKQDMVTKSKQTQYGGKYDGRFHSKKDTPANLLCLEMLL